MTPGPASDSYDPEFGTTHNKLDVSDAIQEVDDHITKWLGPGLLNIHEVALDSNGRQLPTIRLSERQWRIVRFALRRAKETL